MAQVPHAVGLHRRDVDGRSGRTDHFFRQLVGLDVELPAFEGAAQDVHGLMIEVVVDRDLPARGCGKQPQSVIRIAVAVVTELGQPADADPLDVEKHCLL